MLRELWEERRLVATWLGGASGGVIHGLLVALLGLYLPWRMGFDLLDPLVVVPYWCSSLLLLAGAAGEAFSQPAPAPRVRLAVVTAAAFLYGLLVTGLALLTVNAANWHGQVLLPAGAVRWTAPLLSLSASACMAATGQRMIAQGHSAQSVKSRFRTTLWGLVLLLVAGPVVTPGVVREWFAPYLTSNGIAWLCAAGAALLGAAAVWQARKAGG